MLIDPYAHAFNASWLIILGLLDGGPNVYFRSWLARLLLGLVILPFFNPSPKLGWSVVSISSSSPVISNLFNRSFCTGVKRFDLLNGFAFSFLTRVLFSLCWLYQLFFTTSVASNFSPSEVANNSEFLFMLSPSERTFSLTFGNIPVMLFLVTLDCTLGVARKFSGPVGLPSIP